ncbi:MAG: MFS transporter [Candidatus Bathyarchaeia archaeon]
MKEQDEKASGLTLFTKIFVNLGIFQFLTFLRRGIFYTFMVNYLYTLMRTVTSTAALGTFDMIASALGQNLLWGRICDRFKVRTKLIIIGESIAGFTYIIVFFIHRFLIDVGRSFDAGLTIIFGLAVLEFFWSMSDVGWAVLLTDITTPSSRGKIVGSLNFIASLGRMVGIIFAGFLYASGEGFRNGTIFWTVTALLFTGAAIMTFVSKSIGREGLKPTQEQLATEGIVKEKNIVVGDERAYKWFLASLIIIVLGAASVNQIFFLFIKLQDGLNASDYEMSLIISAWTVGGMIASAISGRIADKIGREKVIFSGLILAVLTPALYGLALNVPSMAFIYGLNGVAFWSIQTVGFALAGDLTPEHRRGRLLSRYNAVIALSWGPAGILIGGPFADIQTKILGIREHAAFINAFYLSSAIVAAGTILFAIKFLRIKRVT